MDREAIDEAIGLLAERLAIVQSLASGEDKFVVVMLVNTIL